MLPYQRICEDKPRSSLCGYSKGKVDLKMIHGENNVLMNDDELVVVRGFLRKSKHACLYIQNEHPRGIKLLNHV